MWSAGATLFELATGRILLTGETNNGMLHGMQKTVGSFPKGFATTGEFSAKHFSPEGDFRLKEAGAGEQLLPASTFRRPSQPILGQLNTELGGKRAPPDVDAMQHQVAIRAFADLLTKCAVPNPPDRLLPDVALEYRFFDKQEVP